MYNDLQENNSYINKSIIQISSKSYKDLDSSSNLNMTFDQEYIDKKRIKSIKLFNKWELFRFLNKNFSEIIQEDNYEIYISLSKNILKDQKLSVCNFQKTQNFLQKLKEKTMNTNELFLNEETLITISIILARSFIYSKGLKVANLRQFFYLFGLDLEILKNVEKIENERLENIKIYNRNKLKKGEFHEGRRSTIFKTLGSIFSFGKANGDTNKQTGGSNNSKCNSSKNDHIYLNSDFIKKQKGYLKIIHDDLNSLLENLFTTQIEKKNHYLTEFV